VFCGESKVSKEQKKVKKLVIFGILQYVFLPVLCGFLTAGVLSFAGLERLGLDIFDFTNFPTIKIQSTIWTNYPGLELSAGLGCVIGMVLSRFLRLGARLGHFDFISPIVTPNAISIPSVTSFIKSIIRIISIPAIVVLAAVTSLELAKARMLPGVTLDMKSRLFKVTLTGVVIVAAVGCLLMFVYDMVLTIFLRMIRRKEVEIKEFE
jgi:hypothetical protein